MATKQIKGFISGAWCSSDFDGPTHSMVTLDTKRIKGILKHMGKVQGSKEITAIQCNLGYCDYFRINDLEKVASILGVSADALSNIDTSTFLPFFHEIGEDVIGEELVETFKTGGNVDTEIHDSYVVWKGQEKYVGSFMESPCIDRMVLKKWLKGDFT